MKHLFAEGLQGEVLGIPVHAASMPSALSQVASWAHHSESRAVFFCNAHSLAHARSNGDFRQVLDSADLRLPDGAPVAYMLRRSGFEDQTRVSGPDLMLHYMATAEDRGEPVFLYGSTPSTLDKLLVRLSEDHPRLMVHAYSPPFRELTHEEDEEIVQRIIASGAKTVWVALGCPKQEQWITDHRDRIPAVMLGVGAAFAFHAGVAPRAPEWMQKRGLEWLHRLATDPKRLWKRYLVTNTTFIFYAIVSSISRRSAVQAR